MLDCFVKQYTYWRIRQIFKDDYGLDLVSAWHYKGSRHGNPKLYHLVQEDGTIVYADVTLWALRKALTYEGYPLKEGDE